ncbi:MAG: dienelactone hydrolase family protein [Actinobacteria bacterium]|nr:dienelactone hydrolase family protein [Actinomycetota bacterium]
MAEIVVFHSALGLRPAIGRFAEHLRDHGHVVHTPDLFDGEVFDDLDAAVAHRDTIGIPILIGRAQDAVDDLPEQLVYAGFSMGTAPAQLLAATRPGARGAVLIQGALGLEHLGLDAWPARVPVQLHVAADDPWFDRDDAIQATAGIPDDLLDYHEYPIDAHLFADSDWHEHDAQATTAMLDTIITWLMRR